MPNKKNGGVVPAVFDKRMLEVPIDCGYCMQCMKKKSREWSIRLQEEIKENTNGVFVTLTLSNESVKKLDADIDHRIKGYDRDNKIIQLALTRFLERWRKK